MDILQDATFLPRGLGAQTLNTSVTTSALMLAGRDFKCWIIWGFKTEVIVHTWIQVLRVGLCQTSAPPLANSAKYKKRFQMSPLMNTRGSHWHDNNQPKCRAVHCTPGCPVCVVLHFLGGCVLPAPGELMDGHPYKPSSPLFLNNEEADGIPYHPVCQEKPLCGSGDALQLILKAWEDAV